MAAEVRNTSNSSSWMFFIGVLLFLMGIYGLVRMTDITRRGVPYPLSGVLPSNILITSGIYGGYGSRESDCDPYPTIYYETDNKTVREASEAEKTQEQLVRQRCVNEFNEDRARERQNDKNVSTFLVFVGAGLLFARRFANRV